MAYFLRQKLLIATAVSGLILATFLGIVAAWFRSN